MVLLNIPLLFWFNGLFMLWLNGLLMLWLIDLLFLGVLLDGLSLLLPLINDFLLLLLGGTLFVVATVTIVQRPI